MPGFPQSAGCWSFTANSAENHEYAKLSPVESIHRNVFHDFWTEIHKRIKTKHIRIIVRQWLKESEFLYVMNWNYLLRLFFLHSFCKRREERRDSESRTRHVRSIRFFLLGILHWIEIYVFHWLAADSMPMYINMQYMWMNKHCTHEEMFNGKLQYRPIIAFACSFAQMALLPRFGRIVNWFVETKQNI